jgi:hypothetical protein
MHESAFFWVIVAAFLVGCANSQSISTFSSLSFYRNTVPDMSGGQRSYGGPVGWKLSWNLIGGNIAEVGPFLFTYNGTNITSSGVIISQRTEDDDKSNWVTQQAYDLVDPCVKLVPLDQWIKYSFTARTNAINGTLNITTYYENLLTLTEKSNNPFTLPLGCPIACIKYGLLNINTKAVKNQKLRLTFTSGIDARVTLAGPGECPSTPGPNAINFNLNANTKHDVEIASQHQIWFLISEFEDHGTSNQSQLSVSWKDIDANNNYEPSNSKLATDQSLTWGLVGSAIGLVVVVAITVVIIVVHKKKKKARDLENNPLYQQLM